MTNLFRIHDVPFALKFRTSRTQSVLRWSKSEPVNVIHSMRDIIIFTAPAPVFITVPIDFLERFFRESRHLNQSQDH